jgi:DnaD/phage-associated family protein
MARNGWVKEQRKELDSTIYTNPYYFKLWRTLIMLANHADGKVDFNGKPIPVSSGQLVTGRDALAFIYNRGAQPVHQKSARVLWRWIQKFEEWQMLSIKSTTKYSVISITNWAKYQENDQLMSSSSPASVQQVSTNKKDKNLENDKKYLSSFVARKDVLDFWQKNGFGVLASKTVTDLDYWVKDFQEIGSTEEQANGLLIKAMSLAVDQGPNVMNYRYVNGILTNWEKLKLKSPEEVDAHEQSRNAGRDSKNSSQAGRRSGRGTSQGKSYGGIEF